MNEYNATDNLINHWTHVERPTPKALDPLGVLHISTGLRLMPCPDGIRTVSHTVVLSPCCPVSKNPKAGSTITIIYTPSNGQVIEVYALKTLVGRFVGGFIATEFYPAERNMEGMISLIARMCHDALGVPVVFNASLLLDAGGMELSGVIG